MRVIVRAMIVLSCIVTFAIHEGGRPLVASAAPENLRALSEWPGGVPPGCEPDAPSTTANGNVTIVTQSTTDRLWNLGHVCERWKGPLSLGMTVTPEDPGGVTQHAKRIMAACPEVHVSVLLAKRIPLTKRGLVRCLANGTVAGLPPPPRWTPRTLNLWEGDAVAEGRRRALAAGEDDARRALEYVEEFDGHCEPFHHHGSTRFDAWLASGDAASDGPAEPAPALPCFLSNKYEPFVAVPRCLDGHPGEASHVPRFDERYMGYGKNKIEWIASLRGANQGGKRHMAALGLYVMDIPGVPAGDPAAVVEVDLATPLCGAVAHTIDKLETHSLAPAARAWLRGGEPKARGKGSPTPRAAVTSSAMMFVLELLTSLWSWLTENPMRVLVFAFVARNILKKKEPFPECGGRVVGVHDTKAFDGALASAKAKGELLVCDFFATWCPPCRAAVPIYGRLSETWDAAFVKVDVDECKELARREGIAAMPTFKIYRDGACVETIQGFSERGIVAKLESLGAKKAAAPAGDKTD
ncbi:hypothetical protein JL721_8889 [Aureococcus anophagefferens]|nr:hypothetical protein JL721_8889 [Aureococcus anophagefferens]